MGPKRRPAVAGALLAVAIAACFLTVQAEQELTDDILGVQEHFSAR